MFLYHTQKCDVIVLKKEIKYAAYYFVSNGQFTLPSQPYSLLLYTDRQHFFDIENMTKKVTSILCSQGVNYLSKKKITKELCHVLYYVTYDHVLRFHGQIFFHK